MVAQSDAMETVPVNAVVLPGGGARGAYQVGVLQAIAEVLGPGSAPFRVVCGTSAGAVNATVLASHADSLERGSGRLAAFWSGLSCDRIYRTDPWTVASSALRWFLALASGGLLPVAPAALLDNEPLRDLLTGSLRLDRIPAMIDTGQLHGVAVTASAYTRASAISFFQGRQDIAPWERTRRRGIPTRIGVEHVMASVALPMIFPAQRLGYEYFGDGGMRMGAPLSPALHLGADRILVIGTRDEKPDPEPTSPANYPSAGEVGGYLLDTVFMDTLNADLARLKRINRTLSFMNPEQRAASGLRPVDVLVIRPSRDLRTVTAEHADRMPASVKLLLRTLGGWGRDWRMASYLLFEAGFTKALIELGREDGLQHARRIRDFFAD